MIFKMLSIHDLLLTLCLFNLSTEQLVLPHDLTLVLLEMLMTFRKFMNADFKIKLV